MDFLIVLGAKYLYLVIIAVAAASLLVNKKPFARRSILKLSVISFPLAFVAARILSSFIYTTRPFVVENVKPLIDHVPDNGFPSDHTLLVMSISAVFLIHNRRLGTILIILSAAVGAARILAKVHSPVDIMGSSLIAFSAVIVSWIVLERVKLINQFIDKILSRFKI